MKVIWSPRALERVDELAQRIAQDDLDAALRCVTELFDVVERLETFPASGRVVPEVGISRIREIVFGGYRIFYKIGEQVEALTVRHGSQLVRSDELDSDQT